MVAGHRQGSSSSSYVWLYGYMSTTMSRLNFLLTGNCHEADELSKMSHPTQNKCPCSMIFVKNDCTNQSKPASDPLLIQPLESVLVCFANLEILSIGPR